MLWIIIELLTCYSIYATYRWIETWDEYKHYHTCYKLSQQRILKLQEQLQTSTVDTDWQLP